MTHNFSKCRVVTFKSNGVQSFGVMTDEGVIDLSCKFPNFPTLREVIEADQLKELVTAAEGSAVSFKNGEFTLDIPVPFPEKIICVGVNYPDRNAEYKDGSDAPLNPSLFIRFPGSFTGHNQPLIRPPESFKLDYEVKLLLLLEKAEEEYQKTQLMII
jgi:2-keto-4-pentenoate hydratase/2-oxohepta-3-ene-1,7-dioic acid hydratase in catechol pathway